MARIVYGVAGQGFGHSSRAEVIGQKLIDSGHDVIFVASEKSFEYLKRHFPGRVTRITGLFFVYKNRRLCALRTLAANMLRFPGTVRNNMRWFRDKVVPFKPDVVLSDFEPFSAWWAKLHGVPFVSIDHEHMLTHCRMAGLNGHAWARVKSYFVTRCYYFGASAYIVINFFHPPLKGTSSVLAPPVVRPVLDQFEVNQGKYILYYSTDSTGRDSLVEILNRFGDQRFYVYGFNQIAEYGNCIFKKTSKHGFVKDLAGCRAVIATAGFSLISECLHYRKRMLLLPVSGQYEQILNAHYISQLGLGCFSSKLDYDSVSSFLQKIHEPVQADASVLWPDNNGVFEVLDRVLAEVKYQGGTSPRTWSQVLNHGNGPAVSFAEKNFF